MGYSNGKITAPVSVYDVQRALGVSENDIKTLCLSNRVNMWSKIKPVEPAQSTPVVTPLVLPTTLGVLFSPPYVYPLMLTVAPVTFAFWMV